MSLSDFLGKRIVLYFYVMDDTPGCTTEACNFRDSMADYARRDVPLIGVSPDSVQSHQKFAMKYKLPFTLLADVGAKVSQAYGVWVERDFGGRKQMGVARTTFVIGKDGRIEKIFRDVEPNVHDSQILAWIDLQQK